MSLPHLTHVGVSPDPNEISKFSLNLVRGKDYTAYFGNLDMLQNLRVLELGGYRYPENEVDNLISAINCPLLERLVLWGIGHVPLLDDRFQGLKVLEMRHVFHKWRVDDNRQDSDERWKRLELLKDRKIDLVAGQHGEVEGLVFVFNYAYRTYRDEAPLAEWLLRCQHRHDNTGVDLHNLNLAHRICALDVMKQMTHYDVNELHIGLGWLDSGELANSIPPKVVSLSLSLNLSGYGEVKPEIIPAILGRLENLKRLWIFWRVDVEEDGEDSSRKCFTYGEINGLPPVMAVEGGYINDEDLSEYTVTFMRGKTPTYARNHRTHGRLSAEELTLSQFEHEVQAWFTLNPALETVELCFSETLTSNVSEEDEEEDDSKAMSDSGENDSEAVSDLDKGGDLDSRVLMQRQALDCDPNDDVLLTGLASLLQRRSEETGNQNNIHEAIAIFERLIEIPGDDSVRCSRYNGLGSALTILFRQTKSMGDLDRAIAMTEKAIQTAPGGWPDKGTYLTNLGNLLIDRFEKERSIYILDWAISTNTNPVHFISDDHLTNLGNQLMERLEKEKSMHSLDQAISTLTNAVEFTPDDHPNRGPAFYNLGSAFLRRFKLKGSVNDLHSSTTALAQARNFTPEEGDDYAKLRAKIRDACELKSSNGVSSLSDLQLQLWATYP